MNTLYFYALYALLASVTGQRFNDGFPEADVDYQDFQSPQPTIQRAARPRSPAIASASQEKVTPIPILKQINRHNEDGSYTYGFEGADGSFKIETKLATGEVIGKYGYVDDSGKVRTVEYGANKYGFQPSGEGITIPPVTIGNDTETESTPDEEQFVQPARPAKPPKRKPSRPQVFAPEQFVQRPEPQFVQRPEPQFVQRPEPQFIQRPEPQFVQRPEPRPTQYFVQEQDEIQIRPQRPVAPTPSDVNSLQFVFDNELRNPSFQFRADTPQRKTEPEPIRPFPQNIPIPSAFDASSSPQFAQAAEFSQQFDAAGPPTVANAFRQPPARPQRPKAKPQVLFLAQSEDEAPSPNAVRRNSNVQPPRAQSILDELLKQYAAPNASPAINDFSFTHNA